LKAVAYKAGGAGEASSPRASSSAAQTSSKKETVGVDVYLDWNSGSAEELGTALMPLSGDGLTLKAISNRGVKVWPGGHSETFCSDHWRCRFISEAGGASTITHAQIASLLSRVAEAGFDFIKTENLCNFDGQAAYSHAQE
jgi:isocitrate dehydrogenase